ncbi:MAG: DedA family protein [Chloroflexota bacterium]
MEFWARAAHFLLGLIDQYDDQTVFLLVLIEECGVPMPLPGDLIMMLVGLRARRGEMNLLLSLLSLEAATMIGASVLYWLAARGGRPILYKYGRFIHFDHARLDQAEDWVRRRGAYAIVVGRLIPGLRIPTVLAAGVFGVPYRKFLLALAAGAFGYIAFFVFLGYWLGPRALEMLEGPGVSARAVLTVMAFGGLGWLLFSLYRRTAQVRALPRVAARESLRLETSALAGVVATAEMVLGVNTALYLLSWLNVRLPEQALIGVFREAADHYAGGSVARLAVALAVGLFAAGVLWAVLYTHVAVSKLRGPSWLRGLTFAILPLAASLFVVLPLGGAGVAGFGLNMGWLPLAGELVRHGLFGVGLGTSQALLRAARQAPAEDADRVLDLGQG